MTTPAPPPYQPTPQPTYQPAPPQMKSVGVAYLWLILLGLFGAHQFYLGKTGRAILYLFTLGVLGIGVLVDLFTLPAQTRQVNAERLTGQR